MGTETIATARQVNTILLATSHPPVKHVRENSDPEASVVILSNIKATINNMAFIHFSTCPVQIFKRLSLCKYNTVMNEE